VSKNSLFVLILCNIVLIYDDYKGYKDTDLASLNLLSYVLKQHSKHYSCSKFYIFL